MKNINILVASVLTIVLMTLSACSSDESSSTLTYWSMYEKGEPQQKVLQKIINEFEEENQDVTVEVTWMGRDLLSKVRNSVLSGDAPDLIDKEGSEIKGALGSRDLAEPLNELLDKEVLNENVALKDIFSPGLLDMYKKSNGDVYFVPFQLVSSAVFYDDNLFNKLNVSAPTTWSEFISIAKDIKSQGMPPIALDGKINFYSAYYYYWVSTRINGPGMLNKAAGDPTAKLWDKPGFLKAAKKVEQLAELDLFKKGYEGSQFPTQRDQWAKGEAAMLIEGSWIPGSTKEITDEQFNYRAFPFPKLEEGKEEYYRSVEADLIGWSAPKGADVDLVKDFILFASQEKYQEEISKEAKILPARKDIPFPEESKDFEEMVNNSTGFHEIYDGLRSDYPVWWETVFLPLDDKLIFGEITAEEFIQKIKNESKEFWDKQ